MAERQNAGSLDTRDIERFVTDGYVRLESAISKRVVDECRDWIWRASALDPDDPSSWTEPVVRIHGSQDERFRRAMNAPALAAGIDALVGEGRWQRPIQGTGSFAIRFPSERDPGDAGWHIDGSYSVEGELFANVRSRDRMLLMLVLFSDVGDVDAPTRIRRGSHLRVPPVLEPAGEAGMSFADVVPKIEDLERHPLDLATGERGDVYLCHPFLVHAATWPHRGNAPRFISQPGLAPVEPVRLERPDAAYSAVERAIRIGLGRSD